MAIAVSPLTTLSPRRRRPRSPELSGDRNLAYDGSVEGPKVLGRNPVLQVLASTSLFDLLAFQEAAPYLEASHKARSISGNVPVARDLRGIALV